MHAILFIVFQIFRGYALHGYVVDHVSVIKLLINIPQVSTACSFNYNEYIYSLLVVTLLLSFNNLGLLGNLLF